MSPGVLAVLDQVAGIAERFDGSRSRSRVTPIATGCWRRTRSSASSGRPPCWRVSSNVAFPPPTWGGRSRLDPADPGRRRRGQGRQPPDRVPGDRGTRSLNGKDDMPYTLVKGLVWVVLALLLGVVIGWLLRSLRSKRQIAKARAPRTPGSPIELERSNDATELERLRIRLAELEPIVVERDRLRAELQPIASNVPASAPPSSRCVRIRRRTRCGAPANRRGGTAAAADVAPRPPCSGARSSSTTCESSSASARRSSRCAAGSGSGRGGTWRRPRRRCCARC